MGAAAASVESPPLEGLSSAEAAARLRSVGPNRFVHEMRGARFREVLSTLADPMALMLAAAAVIYFLLGDRENGIILLIALFPVLAIDVVLEARSRKALRALAAAVSPRTRVVRDGTTIEIATEDLVPGDVVAIREGDILFADGTIRWSANLALDESQLTGESEPREKSEGAQFFAGSTVLAGHGYGEVERTGTATRYGEIAHLIGEAPLEPSPLQRKIHQMVRWLAVAALISAVGVFFVSFARGAGVVGSFLPAISLAIAAAPEEFLLVLTIFLTVGAWRLTRNRILVRRLASVETLGATTIICTDKTGTITLGHFRLEEHVPLEPGVSEDDLLIAAVLACEPHPADTLERDVVAHCDEHGIDVARLHADWTLVHDYSFDPIGKHMAHVWESADGEQWIVAKGAMEGILEHCTIAPDERTRAEEANAALAERGYRVLAVGGRRGSLTGAREEDERDLRLYGLIGFLDPVRPEVPAAVEECQRAGIDIKMITGDHVLTAHAVATAAGIRHEDEWITTGDRLDDLDETGRDEMIRHSSILARIRPEQKYEIVDALVRSGETVAMAGDGINDAPALKRASIGIGMGQRGTPVARSAASLVLLDDDFAAIVATVREGRHIFDNLQRAFLFLLPVKLVIVALAFVAPLAGLPTLLLPIHLVWMELITHPVGALAFEGEPAPADLMDRPPRDPRAPLLTRSQVIPSLVSAAILVIASLVGYRQMLSEGEAHARTFALAVVMAGVALLVIASRAADRPWHVAGWPRTTKFWIIWLAVAASFPVIVSIHPAARELSLAPLTGIDWLMAIALAIVAVAWRAGGTRRGTTKAEGRM